MKPHDTFLILGVEKGEEKIPVIFDIARKIGVTITSVNVRKPTLDDVFLYYTGRSIREQDQQPQMKKQSRFHFRRVH
jgi:ABC-2 type transport system ATP-binding protein